MLRAVNPALPVGTTLSVRRSSRNLADSPFAPHMVFVFHFHSIWNRNRPVEDCSFIMTMTAPPSSAEVQESVGLYLYFSSVTSWQFTGRT